MRLALLKGFKGSSDAFVDTLPFVVGRCRTADLIIPHVNISRNHCHIIYEEFQWKICNHSFSGTYINGVLVDIDSSGALREGDVINFSSPENNISYIFYPLNSEYLNSASESRKTDQIFNFSKQSEISFGSQGQKCASTNLIYSDSISNKIMNKPIKCKKPAKVATVRGLEKSNNVVSNIKILEEEENSNQCRKLLLACENKSNEIKKIFSPNKATERGKTKFIKYDSETETKKIKLKADACTQYLTEKVSCSDETDVYSVQTGFKFPIKKSSEIKNTPVALLQTFKKNNTCYFGRENKGRYVNKKRDINSSALLTGGSKVKVFAFGKNETGKGLLQEFEAMKNSLNDLKRKNSALLEELTATTTKEQSEVSHIESRVLQNFTELLESELQCTICSELFIKAVTLGCTHSFCKFCIDQWKLKQKTCPICREKVTTQTRSLVVDNYIEKVIEQLSVELKERRKALVKERLQAAPV